MKAKSVQILVSLVYVKYDDGGAEDDDVFKIIALWKLDDSLIPGL